MNQMLAFLTTPNVLLFVLALVVLLAAMRFKPIWQRNSVTVKGDNYGNISQTNNVQSVGGQGGGAERSPGKGLSFLADILQVVGFAITILQIVGVIKQS